MNESNILRLKNGEEYQIGELILQKKAKDFYAVKDNPKLWVMRCTDSVTQDDDGDIREEIVGKGRLNAKISALLFNLVNGRFVDKHQSMPIKTHFIGASLNNETDCLVYRMAQAIPLEVIVRNWAYGSYVERHCVEEGLLLDPPICEFTLKDDANHDPLITPEQIERDGIATRLEVDHMREVALAVNQIMGMFFRGIGIDLIDFKLVFGRQGDYVGDPTNLRLIGELSPDVCRLRDIATGECLDKDIFRRGLPGLAEAYGAVLQRMSDLSRQESEARRRATMRQNGESPQ